MTDPTQIAADRFDQGLNCSQAVLSTFAAQTGLPEEVLLKLASPFGGGIAHQGQTCGAVTGALLAMGLLRGNATPEGKDETYRLAEAFVEQFKERHKTILCRELIGYDVHVPEELQEAREQNIFHTICPALVKDAVLLVDTILEEDNCLPGQTR
ncbi:MAG: C-GCAxxG-C-C family protein [Chloroflexota bacterium]